MNLRLGLCWGLVVVGFGGITGCGSAGLDLATEPAEDDGDAKENTPAGGSGSKGEALGGSSSVGGLGGGGAHGCLGDDCPVDCMVGDFGAWGECSAEGIRKRYRQVLVESGSGGAECPILYESEECAIDCQVGAWADWSECSKDCDGGERTRRRRVLVEFNELGVECPSLEEREVCNDRPCEPLDCELSDWGQWSPCSKTCGGGTRERTRAILVAPEPGGTLCGDLSQEELCNTDPCVM